MPVLKSIIGTDLESSTVTHIGSFYGRKENRKIYAQTRWFALVNATLHQYFLVFYGLFREINLRASLSVDLQLLLGPVLHLTLPL